MRRVLLVAALIALLFAADRYLDARIEVLAAEDAALEAAARAAPWFTDARIAREGGGFILAARITPPAVSAE